MKFRKIILALIMCVSMWGSIKPTYAATDPIPTTDLDISKTLENRSDKHEYNIVFNLPSSVVEEPIEIDMVFVMDTTTISSYASVRNSINSFLDRLSTNPAIKVNVGVIKFALNITRPTQTLETLNATNISTIKSRFSGSTAAGSNMYGGLLAARELLNTGSAQAHNKYIFVASDFGGYKSDTGNGTGLSFFYNYSYGNQGVAALHNNIEGRDFGPRYRGTPASAFTVSSVNNLIENKVLFSGTAVSTETDKYLTKFGPEASEYPDSWRNPLAHYGIINHTWTQAEKDTLITNYAFTTRDDFPTSFEKNIYQSGHQFLEMKNEGINVVAITSPYQAGTETWQIPFNAASNAFKDWFEVNIGKRYDSLRNETFVDMLDDIESEIVYLVGKGTIDDVIDSRFDVIENSAEVLLNGTALPATQLSSNEIGFGSADNGTYQYVYRYNVIGDKEVVSWDINKEARIDDLLQFKFGVKLSTLPTSVGVHTLETNEHAAIEYITSKEVKDGVTDYTKVQSMPSPTVQIEMGEIITRYVDTNGNVLESESKVIGEVGDAYTTQSKDIENYTLIDTQGDAQGVIGSGTYTVTYVYELNKDAIINGNVIVKYVDENGVEISDGLTLAGEVGTPYQTQEKVIQGYVFKNVTSNASGNFEEGTITVIYTYSKLENHGSVIVEYRDEAGNVIAKSDMLTGLIGSNYTTTVKEISGYTFVNVTDNASGSYATDPIYVIYTYAKDKVTLDFDSKGGTPVNPQTMDKGSIASKPQNPTKKGYEFVGWFTDETFKTPFDFSKPIMQDTRVYAKWQAMDDHEELPHTGVSDNPMPLVIAIGLVALGTLMVIVRKKSNK